MKKKSKPQNKLEDTIEEHIEILSDPQSLVYLVDLTFQNLQSDYQEVERLRSQKTALPADDQEYLKALLEKIKTLEDQIEAWKKQYRDSTGTGMKLPQVNRHGFS